MSHFVYRYRYFVLVALLAIAVPASAQESISIDIDVSPLFDQMNAFMPTAMTVLGIGAGIGLAFAIVGMIVKSIMQYIKE